MGGFGLVFLLSDLIPLSLIWTFFSSQWAQYMLILVFMTLFTFFDASIALYDQLDDGKLTVHSEIEKVENALISLVNLILIISIWKIFTLRSKNAVLAQALQSGKKK